MNVVLNRIKELRDAREWSNYKLAKEAGLPEGSLNNLFRLNNFPTLPTLTPLCEALDISLSRFFADGDDPIILTDDERRVLEHWKTLNENQKSALLELLKYI